MIVIFSKHALPCFCASPWQLLSVIRSGMLLCGVPTRNSAVIPSITRNRNSTRVGAIMQFVFTEWLYVRQPGTQNSDPKCATFQKLSLQVPGTSYANSKCPAMESRHCFMCKISSLFSLYYAVSSLHYAVSYLIIVLFMGLYLYIIWFCVFTIRLYLKKIWFCTLVFFIP